MTKIDIVSGFLGAGKTTFINRLIKEAYAGEKIVLIENEFGEIGVDGGFLKDAGIEISEINSGCICCSLVGDFSQALKKVKDDFSPDRILIEPSGVGKLSDITKAVTSAEIEDTQLNSATVIVDVNKCKMYMKNFGEFFNDQISCAGCIIFSHTDKTTDAKLAESLNLVREKNSSATIITTPYTKLNINDILATMEQKNTLDAHIQELIKEDECPICGHHHDHDEHHHDHDCCHDHDHHEHHHDHDCCHDHDHHEHHHDHDCCHDHEHHEHHHDHDCCHDHEHHEHHHHHADEVFTSWGKETIHKYTTSKISNILNELENSEKYGFILRSKGMVEAEDGSWIYFDYIPEEINVREGSPSSIGKICVIGANLNESEIAKLFEI